MPRTKGAKSKVVKTASVTPSEVSTNCGHEEVDIRGKETLWRCGGHGEHYLKECAKLCV